MNKKLTYTQKGEQPYKHISTFLAPEGSYYVDSVTYVFPVMYITVWEDPKGFLHTIPVWEEEINRAESEEGNMDVFIENTINEDRRLERCMTCKRFFELIEKYSSEGISNYMDALADDVFSGNIKVTPELLEYFKNGEWGNLRTLKNDGSLCIGWEDKLNKEGSLKTDKKK